MKRKYISPKYLTCYKIYTPAVNKTEPELSSVRAGSKVLTDLMILFQSLVALHGPVISSPSSIFTSTFL